MSLDLDFLTHDLVYIDAALAVGLLVILSYRQPPILILRWTVAAGLMVAFSGALILLGSAVYFLPPVTHEGSITPDTPNSFPSHHALLAAATAALVALARPKWSIPFAILAGLRCLPTFSSTVHPLAMRFYGRTGPGAHLLGVSSSHMPLMVDGYRCG